MLKNLNLFWQRVVRRRRRIAKYRFRAFRKFKSGILQFPQEVVMHLAPCACAGALIRGTKNNENENFHLLIIAPVRNAADRLL